MADGAIAGRALELNNAPRIQAGDIGIAQWQAQAGRQGRRHRPL
jgi:hypothetical protein